MAATLVATPHLRAFAQDSSYKPLTAEQLDQIFAPIALYPDSLLSQVMMAATYPLEVVEAARWQKANPGLKGDPAVAAVKDQTWDVSVKSLVAFPPVLQQMSDHLDWTQKVGDATISQQQDVADSIQRLRGKAFDAGNLKTTKEQAVSAQGTGTDRVIIIQPADPQVIYVPTYNPSTAYGTWPYPSSPPASYSLVNSLLRGLTFGAGIAAANAIFGGWNWGGRGNNYVNVNVNKAVNIDNNYNANRFAPDGKWNHDPSHRKGVAYRDPATRKQYNQQRPGADQRQQFRGQTPETRPNGNSGANRGQGAGGGQRSAERPQSNGRPQGSDGLNGVERGQQVNRESARGHAQQNRAASHQPQARGQGGGGSSRPTRNGSRGER